MSKLVDERVVEMSFDNKKFESNVGETLGTLDKLKKALNFDDAADTFNQLETAADDVDFSEFEHSVGSIGDHLSAFEAIAIGAFTRVGSFITDKLLEIGGSVTKFVGSVTTDLGVMNNLGAGWNKYDEYTQAVQSLVNSTGKDVEEIEGYLSKLMWYSDETSFSFTEMANALSQAALVGADLGNATDMIMGVANATAYAGKEGFAFQSTVRNIMQSYGAGSLQYMDYKSLIGQGTATKELQDQIIKAAEELGTIDVGSITAQNFNESLKDDWATQEVMELAFSRFGEMTQMAYELIEEGQYETASEAYEAIQLLNSGLDDYQVRAALAGQEAISFNQAVSATAEAVQSKIMQVFKFIFGNYDEAKGLWTDLAELLYNIHAVKFDNVIEMLEIWHDGVDGAKSGFSFFWDAIYNIFEAIGAVIDAAKEAWQEIFPKAEAEDVAHRLYMISWYFWLISDRIKRFMTDADRLSKFQSIVKGVAAVFSILKTTVSAVFTIISSVFKAFTKGASSAKESTSAFDVILGVLANIGDGLVWVAERWSELVDSFINGEVFQTVLAGISGAVSGVKTVVMDFLRSAWPVIQTIFQTVGKGVLYAVGGALYAVGTAAKWLFDKVVAVVTVLSGFFKALWPKIQEFAKGVIARAIYGVTIAIAAIGGAIQFAWDELLKLYDMLSAKLAPVLEVVSAAFEKFKNSVKEAWNNIGDTATSTWDKISAIFEIIKKELKTLWGSVKTAFTSNLDPKVFDPIINALKNFWKALMGGNENQNGDPKKSGLIGIISSIWEFLKIAIPAISELLASIFNTMFGSLSEMFTNGNMAETFQGINAGLGAGVLIELLKMFKDLGKVTTNLKDSFGEEGGLKGLLNTIKEFIGMGEDKEEAGIKVLADSILKLVAALVILSLIDAGKMKQGLGGFSAMLLEIGALLGILSKTSGTGLIGIAAGLKALGLAMIELSLSIIIISKVDPERLWESIGALGVLMAEIEAFVALFALIDSKVGFGAGVLGNKNLSKTFKEIGVAMILLSAAILIVAQVDPPRLWAAVKAIAIMLGAIGAIVAAVAGLSGIGKVEKRFAGVAAAILMIGLVIGMLVGDIIVLTAAIQLLEYQKIRTALTIMGAFFTGVLLMVAAMTIAAKTGGEDIALVGAAFLGMAVGVEIMVGVLIALAAAVKFIGGDVIVTAAFALMLLGLGLGAFLAVAGHWATQISMLGTGVFMLGVGILALVAAIDLLVITLGTAAALGSVILVGAQSLVAALIAILKGLLEGIITLVPLLVQALVTLILGSIVELGVQIMKQLKPLADMVVELITGLLKAVNDSLESKGATLGTELGRTLFIIIKLAIDALISLIKESALALGIAQEVQTEAVDGVEEGASDIVMASSGIGGGLKQAGKSITDFFGKVKVAFIKVKGWVVSVIDWIKENLVPIFKDIFEDVKVIIPVVLGIVRDLIDFIAKALPVIGPLITDLLYTSLEIITSLVTIFTTLSTMIIGFLNTIIENISSGGLLPFLLELSVTLSQFLGELFLGLLDTLITYAPTIVEKLVELTGLVLVGLFEGLIATLPTVVEKFVEYIIALLKSVNDALEANKEPLEIEIGRFIALVISIVVNAIINALKLLWAELDEKTGIPEFLGGIWEKVVDFWNNVIKPAFEWVAEKVSWIWERVIQPIIEFVETIWDAITRFAEWLFTTLTGVFNWIVGAVTTVINTVWGIIQSIVDFIVGVGETIWTWIGEIIGFFSGMMSDIGGILSGDLDFFETAKGWIEDIIYGIAHIISLFWQQIDGIMSSIAEKLGILDWYNTAKEWIQGLINGILDFANGIIEGVKGLAEDVASAWNKFWGIASPSKLMRESGHYIDEGVILGLNDMAGDVANAAGDVGAGAVDSMQNAMDAVMNVMDSEDYSPTITPVYDLSALYSGKEEINSLLDSDPTALQFKMGDEEGLQDAAAEIDASNTSVADAVDGMYSKLSDFMTKVKGEFGDNNVTLNVYGAEGQDVEELADIVSVRINAALQRERAVYN